MIDLKDTAEFLYRAGIVAEQAKQEKAFFQVTECGGVALYVDQTGKPITSLNNEIERRLREPDDVRRVDKADDIASFCAMVKRHGNDGEEGTTEVFVGKHRAVAVLDMAGWRRHVIQLDLTYCEEWRFWREKRTVPAATAAEEIAPFADVVASDGPVSADQLLDALGGLEWTSERKSTARMSSAGITLKSADSELAVNLPNRVEVLAPVFEFDPGTVYRVPIRVSAKMMNRTRSLVFSPSGAIALQRRAVANVHEQLAEGLPGFPVHLGEPAEYRE